MPWYFDSHGVEIGPLTDSELRDAVQSGAVQPSTMIRNDKSDWTQAKSVKGLKFAPVAAPAPPARKEARKETKKSKSFMDYGFNRFATPVLVKVLWALSVLCCVIAAIGATVSAFLTDLKFGLSILPASIVLAALILFVVRISLETAIVLFSIDATLKRMHESE